MHLSAITTAFIQGADEEPAVGQEVPHDMAECGSCGIIAYADVVGRRECCTVAETMYDES